MLTAYSIWISSHKDKYLTDCFCQISNYNLPGIECNKVLHVNWYWMLHGIKCEMLLNITWYCMLQSNAYFMVLIILSVEILLFCLWGFVIISLYFMLFCLWNLCYYVCGITVIPSVEIFCYCQYIFNSTTRPGGISPPDHF